MKPLSSSEVKARSDLDKDRMLVLSLIRSLKSSWEGGSWFAINEKAKEVVRLTIIGAVRIYALEQFREIASDFKLNET